MSDTMEMSLKQIYSVMIYQLRIFGGVLQQIPQAQNRF